MIKKISKFTRAMVIYIIVMLMLLCAFQTYYIHKLEKQIDDRDRIIPAKLAKHIGLFL